MTKKKSAILATALTAVMFSTSSHAALDVAVTDAFTNLQGELALYTPLAYSILAAVMTLFIGIKWVKRIFAAAT